MENKKFKVTLYSGDGKILRVLEADQWAIQGQAILVYSNKQPDGSYKDTICVVGTVVVEEIV